jgi:hypothetical protein
MTRLPVVGAVVNRPRTHGTAHEIVASAPDAIDEPRDAYSEALSDGAACICTVWLVPLNTVQYVAESGRCRAQAWEWALAECCRLA